MVYYIVLISGIFIFIVWGTAGLHFCNNYMDLEDIKNIKDPRKKVLVFLANGPIVWMFELYYRYEFMTTNNSSGTPKERLRRKLRAWGGLDEDAER